MANQNPRKTMPKAKVTESTADRAQRIEVLATMVIAASVLFRQAEAAMAEAMVLAARDMTAAEQTTVLGAVAEATRPYSEAMVRRIVGNPEAFGCLAPTLGAPL